MLLIGFRDGKEAEPFWLKPLLIKEMFYAFLRKNKVFYKISGIDRYLSSCALINQQTLNGFRLAGFPDSLLILLPEVVLLVRLTLRRDPMVEKNRKLRY